MKVLITGGHLTPALAVIDYIQTHHPETEIVFVGREFSQDRLKQLSHEESEVKAKGIRFRAFNAPRLSAGISLKTMTLPVNMTRSVRAAWAMMGQERPTVVLSFGGYLAVPIAMAAKLRGIPIVTHEQTRVLGTATRLIARIANKVALSFELTDSEIPASKKVVTGNPVRPQLLIDAPKPEWYQNPDKLPVLYVTGGNQGSQILNDTVAASLETLLPNWYIIHQIGNPTSERDFRKELTTRQNHLPEKLQKRYHFHEWVSEPELTWIYDHATAVVSRAGANTVQELIIKHVPSILVPLPFAHHQEQIKNASWLSKQGGSIVLPQHDLSPETLATALSELEKQHAAMVKALKAIELPADAAARIYQVLLQVIQ